MKYKKINAEKIESFMEKEFEVTFPLTVINNNVILFKQFKIEETPTGQWALSRLNSDVIYNFKFKSTAIVAAHYYSKSLYRHIEELKCLDFDYWSNMVDVSFYKQRINEINDRDRKDVFISRLGSAYDKTKFLRKEIIKRLTIDF